MKALPFILGAGVAAAFPGLTGEPRSLDIPRIELTNVTKINMKNAKSSAKASARSIFGPFMGVNFPDPTVISANGLWYAFATTSNGLNVPFATSEDVFPEQGSDTFTWTLGTTDALPSGGAWADTSKGIWAPDIQINDAGTFVMYYTAWQNGGTHCIGVATSATATGPYTPQSTPLICDDAGGGTIDASGYDDGTNRWILWKVDGSALGGLTTCVNTPTGSIYYPTPIMIQQMNRDALTLVGSASQILDNLGANNDGIVEAPSLYKISDGNYVLFYSAHCYDDDNYDIEAAFSSTINGAYTDRVIVMNTANPYGIYGPGGLDIDPNGHTVVFHGRLNANDATGARELFSGDISITRGSVTY
ncbi:glycoside hydrolase family 43 protein [Xylaria venustula]|nr:glycoside hydrolase family 43 protein [Xylaria venustula]